MLDRKEIEIISNISKPENIFEDMPYLHKNIKTITERIFILNG